MIAALRVLVVSSYGLVGGAERWLLDLLDATPRLQVSAVLLGAGPLERELADRRIPARVVVAGRRPAALVVPAMRLASILRRERPDVVLANGFKAGLVGAVAGRLAGVPTVWATHDHSFDGAATRVVAALVDGVVATSDALAMASGHPSARVVVPPRPLAQPLPRAEARAILAARGAALGDDLVLAMVGRLMPYKGCADAVRALAQPCAGNWRLVLVGEPDPSTPHEQHRLAGLAERLGVGDRVHFTGPIPHAHTLFRAFDALAVLTRASEGPGREGFGITALEAMTAGVPVVAVGPGPVADRVGTTAGIVVGSDNPAAVAAALTQLADPDVRLAAGAAGAAIAATHPTADGSADYLVRHLAEVARRPGAGLVGTEPISVVVTILDEEQGIDELLHALRAQLRLADDEIVVVDGGSRDATVDRVTDHVRDEPRVRLVHRPGAGISAGRNAGVALATNEWIACTDAGCRPAGRWLEALRSAGAEREPADLLTGVYRVAARGRWQAAMAAVGFPDPDEVRRATILVRTYGRFLGRAFDATMPTGRSVAFSRAAWRRVRGFPEHLQTGEDVLFGRAIARGGRAVLVHDAEVEWAQRAKLRATVRMYFRYGQGSGLSRDRRLLARDLARAFAYAVAPLMLRRPAGAAALGMGLIGYLSLPLARALRRPDPLGVIPLLPVAAAVRDLAKAAGCLAGLAAERAPEGR